MEQELRRRRWIVYKILQGWANNKIASHLRISERTVIRWYNAYRQYGWDGLEIKSGAPYTVYRTPDDIVNKILIVRRMVSDICDEELYLL